MAKIVVFGVRENASLAHFYLTHDSEHQVVGFSVNQEYLPSETTFEGLPIVAFEDVATTFEPTEYRFFAPLSPAKMNKVRESVYLSLKAMGYKLISYVSSKATIFPGSVIGDNCFILEDNTVQPFVQIGNNIVLWSGNHIGHHSTIKDHVFFTSHVVLSGRCTVESYSFFGVNSAVRDGIHIAEGSLVAMSSCLVHDTEPWGIYRGLPAKRAAQSSKDFNFE